MFSERRVISTIRRVLPGVVSIMLSKRLEDLVGNMPPELVASLPAKKKSKTEARKVLERLADSDGMVKVGGGSGFVVDSKGLILTNKHVLGDAGTEHTVILNDGRKFPAKVLSRDPINDIAVLRVEATGLPTVRLGTAAGLELGQTVIAIGNALGVFKNTVSMGIISGLSRIVAAKDGGRRPPHEMRGMIQTDAAINPGNSGGPLVNLKGQAVGVNTAVVSEAQAIGFAIPISAAKRDLEDLRKYGRIRRPYLGVRYLVINEEMAKEARLPVDYGALVIRESPHDAAVVPGSPADSAGILENDIILQCNTERIDWDHPLQGYLDNLSVGDVLDLNILRGGKEVRLKLTLAERK